MSSLETLGGATWSTRLFTCNRTKDYKMNRQKHELQTHQGGKACSALAQDSHGAEALLVSPTLNRHIVYLPAKNIPGPVKGGKK